MAKCQAIDNMTNTEQKKQAQDALLRKLCNKLKEDRDAKRRKENDERQGPEIPELTVPMRRLDYNY